MKYIAGSTETVTHESNSSVSGMQVNITFANITYPTTTKPTNTFAIYSQKHTIALIE